MSGRPANEGEESRICTGLCTLILEILSQPRSHLPLPLYLDMARARAQRHQANCIEQISTDDCFRTDTVAPPRCVCCGVLRVWCPGLMHVQRPGGRVAVCGSCSGKVLFVACVMSMACVDGLTFLAYACAFDGFLLWFLLFSISQQLRLFVTN